MNKADTISMLQLIQAECVGKNVEPIRLGTIYDIASEILMDLEAKSDVINDYSDCLLYTSPSPRDS